MIEAQKTNGAAHVAEPWETPPPGRFDDDSSEPTPLERLAKIAVIGREQFNALASTPVTWAWRDIVIIGIVVVIAGGPGSGKTTLLFLILAARANRGAPLCVLGREVTPAPEGRYIVIVEGEHSDTSAARKLLKSLRLIGVDEGALERVVLIARRGVRIGSPEWSAIEELIAAGKVSDVALDTLARVAPADANDEREQVAIFDRIASAIERAPTADTRPIVWVAAHTRKGEATDVDDVSGSAQRTGQADTVLLVKAEKRDGRVTSSKVTFAKLREEPEEWPAPVEYVVTRDAVVDVAAPAADDRPLEDRIVDRLALGPKTKNALAKELARSAGDVDEALTNLFAARLIETTEVTVRGRPFKAFALRNDTRRDTRRGFSPDDTRRDPTRAREGGNHAE